MNQKEKITYLINEYEKNNYSTEVFCDQFEYIFFLEKDGSIPESLYGQTEKYARIFGRFSPYEDDIKSGVLFDENKIRLEFKELLKIWNKAI